MLLNMSKQLGLMGLLMSTFIPSLHAWTLDYSLPSSPAVSFPATNSTSTHSQLLYTSYSIDATDSASLMPVQRILQGQSVLLKILVPPGVSGVSIGAESGQWQGVGASNGQGFVTDTYPVFKAYSDYPGEFCAATRASSNGKCQGVSGTYIYKDDLKAAAGGMSENLYQGQTLDKPRYVYLAFYHPTGAAFTFSFVSLGLSYIVSDHALYNTWRSCRSWAGGTSTSIDGIGETTCGSGTNTNNNGNNGNNGNTNNNGNNGNTSCTLTSTNPFNVNSGLDIYVPSATYSPEAGVNINLWVDLEFMPVNGVPMWKLRNYGVNK